MPFTRRFLSSAPIAALSCLLAVTALPVAAQSGSQTEAKPAVNAPAAKPETHSGAYAKGRSLLTVWGPYKPVEVTSPVLSNTADLQSLVRDGKIMLSMKDAIRLALENNLDIAIARYNLDIADTDILKTKAGSAYSGVNTGLITGTLGGSSSYASGSGAGGTSSGAGGAASGAGGVVASTSGSGSAIDSFDPIVTGTLSQEQQTSPSSSVSLYGVPATQAHSTAFNLGYGQGFQSGTSLSLSFDNSRYSYGPNSYYGNLLSSSYLSPQISGSFKAQVRQHLLSGFGIYDNPNTRMIRIAKINRKITDSSFRNQIIYTVSQIQNLYWDLVNAVEDKKVKEHSLQLAERNLSDNKKQVEIGTLAPIEIVRAQSQVASAKQDLIVSQTTLQYQQLLMLNAITRNLNDTQLAMMPVTPTDSMTISNEDLPPVDQLIADAVANRPEVEQSRLNLESNAISKKSVRNAMLPTLDAVAWYGSSGLSGNVNCAAADVQCRAGRNGLGSALGDAYSGVYPDKGVALQLTIPLRNRAAQAQQMRSELEYRQNEMQLQQQLNTIALGVRQAAFAVQQDKVRVEAARAAQALAAQTLDAEEKKYALGASTSFNVLQAQRDLIQAETNTVAAITAYEKARVQLDQLTTHTLENNNIYIADAVSGVITHEPVVKGVVTTTDKK